MRYVVAVFVLAILALGAWFARDRGELRPANAETPHATDGSREPVPSASAPAPARDAREEVAAPAAVPTGDVLVVRFGSNEPIAGAEVLAMALDVDWNALAPEIRELADRDREAYLRRFGVRATTGRDGRCRVAFGARGVQVIARSDDMRAEDWLQADTRQPLVLALRPDRTLHVRVECADGRAAPGLSVIATRRGDDQDKNNLGVTDARGVLTYVHLQELARTAPTAALELRAMFAGGESDAVTIEATEPPPEVVLRLPPCGTVLVHVRDAEGRPLEPALLGNPSVRLGVWPERPTDRNAEDDGLGRSEASAPIDDRGDATFSAVALDRFVIASFGGMRSAGGAGPTLREPRTEIVLQESADTVVFTGVLLDDQQQPLVGGFSLARYTKNGWGSSNARSDANGRFRIDLGPYGAGQRAVLAFSASPRDGRGHFGIELPARDVIRGVNDLGTLRLAPWGVLAQGRAVGDGAAEPRLFEFRFERLREGAWRDEWSLQRVWSGASFTVRSGVPAGAPMRLVVLTNAYLPLAPIEFAAGATNLEVPLQRGGSLTATLLVDVESVPARWLRLHRVEPPPAPGEREREDDGWSFGDSLPLTDGKAQRSWRALLPGRYRLDVRVDGSAEPIAVVDAIDVPAGACTDPRLDAIDLRGRVRTFGIRATGADGKAIASEDAFVVVRGGKEWNGFQLGTGVVTLTVASAVDLLVVAPGHRAAFVDQVFEARTVALEGAPSTTLAFALPTPVPEGLRVRVQLEPRIALVDGAHVRLNTGRGMPVNAFLRHDASLDADGRVAIKARCPGTHYLSVQLGTDARESSLDITPPAVTLPASGDIAVRIDAASWARALQKAGK